MPAQPSTTPSAVRRELNDMDVDRVTPINTLEDGNSPPASPSPVPATVVSPSIDAIIYDGALKERPPRLYSSMRSSVESADVKVAAAIISSTVREKVIKSCIFALKGALWATVMCIPSLVIILARIPSLEDFGRAVATHDPERKYPPVLAPAPVGAQPADYPPNAFWRLAWTAHLDESVQNTVQAFSAFILVVLHITYTHERAHMPQMRQLRRFVFLVCTPAFLLQLFGRTLMFTSLVAQNALIYLPWTIAVVICSKRCKKPLACPNFAFAVALETFAYMLIGAIYIFILVPIVMVGAPGRQAIILVISLPLIRTMGTTISRLGSFIATGLAPEHACVFGLIVPCARRARRARTYSSPFRHAGDSLAWRHCALSRGAPQASRATPADCSSRACPARLRAPSQSCLRPSLTSSCASKSRLGATPPRTCATRWVKPNRLTSHPPSPRTSRVAHTGRRTCTNTRSSSAST